MKNTNCATCLRNAPLKVQCPSIIVWKVKYPLCFFVNLLHSNTNQDPVEKYPCNQDFIAHVEEAITELTLFAISKDEWNTEEDTG